MRIFCINVEWDASALGGPVPPCPLTRIPLILLVIVLTGCATLPIPSSTGPRERLSSELVSYYDYPRQPMKATVESTREGDGFRFERIQLEPQESPGSRPITIDWYEPGGASGSASSSRSHQPHSLSPHPNPLPSPPSPSPQRGEGRDEGEREQVRAPVVLMSPILAGDDLYVREFAEFYAERGLNAVLVYRPKEVFSADRDLGDIETHFRESIIQLRQTIDWLEGEEEADAKRIGTFAISLGSILTTVLAAVEPRISVSVLGLPAGHIPEIIMASQDKAIRKRRKAYLERNGWTNEQALDKLRQVIVSEPMTFAPAIDPSRTLLIAGLFDRVLGIGRSLDLWRAMGRPRLIVLPTGHYTAVLATPYLKLATYSFLKRGLQRVSVDGSE